MNKNKGSILLALLAVTAGSLASCGEQKADITFWSSFGATYKNATQDIVDLVTAKTGIKIKHLSQGNYDKTKEEMVIGYSMNKYPNIAMGYPDHFAQYLSDDGLTAIDDYLEQTIVNDKGETVKLIDDYYPEYMNENYFTARGKTHAYAVPFNKSTEVLGYNGTFVSYCATQDPSLGTLPKTWQEWEVQGPKYLAIYDNLIDSHMMLYGRQDVRGETTDFKLAKRGSQNDDGDYVDAEGRKGLLDFTDTVKEKTRLMSWDATDNAFITLVRQWGGVYTELPEDQKSLSISRQKGNLCFGSSTNMPKVTSMLKFFNKLNKQRIFGIPYELQGSYSSDAFALNSVMFMVCSSGGLSYNTKTWNSRFKIAPIPYYDDGVNARKYVISQGANICMTDLGEFDKSFEVMKELTTGDIQVTWALKTGYYPCSKSAGESKRYKDFVNEGTTEGIQEYVTNNPGTSFADREKEVYSVPSRVAFREGSMVNSNEYMNKDAGWNKFVDAAFKDSSLIRTVVKDVFKSVFMNIGDAESADSVYSQLIKSKFLNNNDIQNSSNINVVQ